MDESDNPTLHRFLSFCRLFMEKHPRVGAHAYAIFLGDLPYKLGWNALHRSKSQSPGEPDVMYMWVSTEGSRLTPQKPEIREEEISHFFEDDLADVRNTAAWRQYEELAQLLIKQNDPRFPPDKVSSVVELIQRTGLNAPLRGDDGTIRRLFDSALLKMKSVIDTIEGSIPLPAFLQPANDIVHRYLAFELCGVQAANALTNILNYCCLNIPSPLSNKSPANRIWDCSRHLRARTHELLKSRNKLNLTSFYDATYLACLYGETAILGYKFLLTNNLLRPEDAALVQRESFAVDEKIAHEGRPTLNHPILLVPFGMVEAMWRTRYGIGDTTGLYPGARGNMQPGSDFESTLKAIQLHSSNAEAIAIDDTVENENCPASEELKEHLATFLLTISIGKRMP